MTVETKRVMDHMIRASMIGLLLAGTVAPAFAEPGDVAAVADDGVVLMSVGSSKVVNLSAVMSDVIVADPTVADVHVRSQHQLYVIAKGPGQTDITITTAGGRVIYHAKVRVGSNLTSVDQMLKLAMPEADIMVSTLNKTILLTGTVAAPEDAAEAQRLVKAFVDPNTNVISRLKTATPLTVNLQVRIAEVSKTLSKQIGTNLMTYDATSGFKFGVGQGRTSVNGQWVIGGTLATGPGTQTVTDAAGNAIGSGISSLTSGTTLATAGRLFGLDILSTIDLAENQGLATTLANPNLTAQSGETASFLAGGEIPIPISTSLGQVSVEYKQYGVSLSFTPTVLADGRIAMRVRPEVSQLDDSAGVRLNGFAVPGIATRRAETTVELGSGQSFMIGGLLSSDSGNSLNKAPFLGDLPVLGNLFKSTSYRRRETELVIVVTPYLVKPVSARDIHLPTDGFRNATDAQRILGAKLHDGKTDGKRPVPTMAPPQTVKPEELSGSDKPAGGNGRSGKGAAGPGFSF